MAKRKKMFKLDRLRVNPDNPFPAGTEEMKRLKRQIEKYPAFLALRPVVYDDADIVDGRFLILGGNKRCR